MSILKKVFKNPFFLAVLSAVLLGLSYPKSNLWILAWCAFVPLFYSIDKQRPGKTLLLSFLSGFLFFALTLSWVVHVTVPGMFVLSAYLALTFAVFCLVYNFMREKLKSWQVLSFVPALWVLLEFTRSHALTGFPWALLGYSQAPNLMAIQAADIFGAAGVSFMVVFVNIFLFELFHNYGTQKPFVDHEVLIPFLIILCWLAYGAYRLHEPVVKRCALKVAVVQGNISQDIKWVTSFQDKIFKKYKLLTELVALKDEPDLVVWPETSFPDYLVSNENDGPLKDMAMGIKTPLLAGSIRLEKMRYYNSALLYSDVGKIRGVYDKIHLVPFGEYIPMRRLLPFVERILPIEDFTAGSRYEIFSVAGSACRGIKFGVLICFEDIFGEMSRQFVRRGADFLVNMTNDAWFGDTASPYQHMQASVLRAVENRVYVLRAANTGVSCFIDDTGRVFNAVQDLSGKETFVTGCQSGFVFKSGRRSVYTKTGDWFSILCIFYVAGMILGRWRARA